MVVAGVMINGDRTYRALEGKLRQIVSEEIPAQDRDAFVFHATDVFHGSRYFNRERWPQVDRQRILQKLASIPSEFGLPIVFGAMSRADYDASSDQVGPNGELPFGKTIEDLTDIGLHATAFMVAEFAIERQMQMFPRDEVCMVICEDTDRVKAIIKQTQAFLRSGKNRQIPQFAELAELPFKKIVDTPHFASKNDSLLLQIADVCAFLICRRLNRKEGSQPYFEAIAPQLFWWGQDFGLPMGGEPIAPGSRY